MKRIILLFSSLVLLVALAACGKSGEKAEADNNNDAAKSGKGDVIEAEVEDASYILAGDSGEGEDSGLLLINLNIKNVSDSSIDLFPENNMQLYDGVQQIDPSSEASMLLDRDTTSRIDADKQKSMHVVLDFVKDKDNELNYVSNIKNKYDASIYHSPKNKKKFDDGDQKRDISSEASMRLDIYTNSSIGADKQKSMPVVIDVDKDTEYELNIEPRLTDPDAGDADV